MRSAEPLALADARFGPATLAGLRRSYDLLLHKLHSLHRDADRPFALDIDRPRAAIWGLLDAVGREPMRHEPVKV